MRLRHKKRGARAGAGRALNFPRLPLRLALLGILALTSSGLYGQSAPSRPPAVPAAQIQPQRTGRRLFLTYSRVDVRDVLAEIADYSGTDIVITPGTNGVISINLRNRTADEAIRLVAASAGLTVLKAGSVYMVGPAAEIKKTAGEIGQTEVVALRYITPEEAVTVLGRVAPNLRAEASRGSVILTGVPADIALARTALQNLDVKAAEPPPPKTETQVYGVHSADPETIERVIHEAFPGLKVTRHERSLIIVGTNADLQAVGQALAAIDMEAPKVAEKPQLVVYRLKFLNGMKAVDTLKAVFPSLVVTQAPEPNIPPAAAFNPLSSSGFGGSNGNGSTTSGFGGGSGGGVGGGGANSGTGGAGGTGITQGPFSRVTRLILSGTADDIAGARQLLDETDTPQPLVRIEALLVEINRDDFNALGIKWDVNNPGFTFSLPGGNGLDFQNGVTRGGTGNFTTTLQAMITKNHAKLLSRPNISVVDNEDASIFIGDTIRFPGALLVTQNSGTVQGIESLPVGIALLVRPRIHPNGEVTLKVHPVVSTATFDPNGLPRTSSREADTTVRLKEGEELVIGGLDRREVSRTEQKLPILGDIPVLGEFFRTRSRTVTNSEVVVVIRVYPVLTETAPPREFKPDPKKDFPKKE